MKVNRLSRKVIVLIVLAVIYMASSLVYAKLNFYNNELKKDEKTSGNIEIHKISDILFNTSKQIIEDTIYNKTVVFDGLTREELIAKINRSLNSTLAGKGEIFVNHSLELGIDPYLALAITLQETGCQWDCSYLVKACNNVGGQKGYPGCDGGSYKAYDTIDEGIIGYLDNLYYNYYAYGLTTPEAMNPKYAESTAWAYKVNNYIDIIRAA